jgi:guanosine-3',5'-bis(diphosphate) 3'-pyrophosphohydrolase
MNIQDTYQKTLLFAARQHQSIGQTIPGTDLPYIIHLSNVAMELIIAAGHSEDINLEFALPVALLHDVIEDTPIKVEDIIDEYGNEIALSVLALSTKTNLCQMPFNCLTSSEKNSNKTIRNSLRQTADRITNFEAPPSIWSREKE